MVLPLLAQLAPPPLPRPADRKWDVFVSYRSVDRPWAIALSDTLRELGYTVFVDQYVLPAGSTLAVELNKALQASMSGVLIWSSHTADSMWVDRERGAFKALRDRSTRTPHPFHTVMARLDATEPDPLDQGDIYLDFSAYPDGPTGSELLRLLYGLRGEPLSDDAVKATQRLDEQVRDDSAAIRAARRHGNPGRILALANTGGDAWEAGSQLWSAAADALCGLKKYDDALQLIAEGRRRFPRSLRLAQLQGLALRRTGRLEEAQAVLGVLYEQSHRDPETLGIYAATFADQWALSQERIWLETSRQYYAEAFELSPSDSYVGVNAASKSALLGDSAAAKMYADRVYPLVEGAKASDYWAKATQAEVLLLRGDIDGAVAAYRAARVGSPGATGDHDTTRTQLGRLVTALALADTDAQRLLTVFA